MSRGLILSVILVTAPVVCFASAHCNKLQVYLNNDSNTTWQRESVSDHTGTQWDNFPMTIDANTHVPSFYLEDTQPFYEVEGTVTYSLANNIPNKLTGQLINGTMVIYFQKDYCAHVSGTPCSPDTDVHSDVKSGDMFINFDNNKGKEYCPNPFGSDKHSQQANTEVVIYRDPAVMSHLIIKYPKSTNHLADVRKIDSIVKNIRSQYSRYFDVSQSDMITIDADNDPSYISIEVRVVCDSQACLDLL